MAVLSLFLLEAFVNVMHIASAVPASPPALQLGKSYQLSVTNNDGTSKQYQIRYNITSSGTVTNMHLDSVKKALVLSISSPSTDGRLAIELPRDLIDAKQAGHENETIDFRANGCQNVTSSTHDCDFAFYDQDFVITATKNGEPQDESIVLQPQITEHGLDNRTLVFDYPKGETVIITIQGTYAVPEFSPIVVLVITAGIMGFVAMLNRMINYRNLRAR